MAETDFVPSFSLSLSPSSLSQPPWYGPVYLLFATVHNNESSEYPVEYPSRLIRPSLLQRDEQILNSL